MQQQQETFTWLAGNLEGDEHITDCLFREHIEESGEMILTHRQIREAVTRDIFNGSKWDRQVYITLTPEQFAQIQASTVLKQWQDGTTRCFAGRHERKAASRWVFIPRAHVLALATDARLYAGKELIKFVGGNPIRDIEGNLVVFRGFMGFHLVDWLNAGEVTSKQHDTAPFIGGSIVLMSPDQSLFLGLAHVAKAK